MVHPSHSQMTSAEYCDTNMNFAYTIYCSMIIQSDCDCIVISLQGVSISWCFCWHVCALYVCKGPRDHSACSGELPGQTERRRKASRFLNSNGSRQQNVGRSGEDDHQWSSLTWDDWPNWPSGPACSDELVLHGFTIPVFGRYPVLILRRFKALRHT